MVTHDGAGEPQLPHGQITQHAPVCDARPNLAWRQQVCRRETSRCGSALQEPGEVTPARAESVPPLKSLPSCGKGGVHEIAVTENPFIPVDAIVQAVCQRSPYTEPPGSGILSHPGSPNVSQQGHPN